MMGRLFASTAIAMTTACAAPAQLVVESEKSAMLPDLPLGRFMREEVNVPFSFVMLEAVTTQSDRRVHRAAIVLREAARDLLLWDDPPVESVEGRDVFYAYAQNLEFHVGALEDAAAQRETQRTADSVEQIRQTCNNCHRFFRPASVISPDVAYDWHELELGGFR